MKETLDAIYENGVLKPLRELSLRDGRKLRITLESQPEDDIAPPSEDEKTNGDVTHLAGSLKGSPRFKLDPLEIQKSLRDEWE